MNAIDLNVLCFTIGKTDGANAECTKPLEGLCLTFTIIIITILSTIYFSNVSNAITVLHKN